MADYAQLMNLEKKPEGQSQSPSSQQHTTPQPINHSVDQSTNRSTTQSIDQSTNQSTNFLGTKVVDKPKAFYITERLDKRLDEAVRYFQEKHGIRKVDRSILVNVLLDNEANWTEEALSPLVVKVISQLTSRLTNR